MSDYRRHFLCVMHKRTIFLLYVWHLAVAPRQHQEEDSERIVNAVRNGKVPLLNEPPGFGKTLTVINAVVELMGTEDVVLIVTPTKKLAQYWAREIEKSGVPLSYAVVIGKKNFTCPLAGDEVRADDPRIVCNLNTPVASKLVNCKYYAPPLSKSIFELYKPKDVLFEKEYTGLYGSKYVAFSRGSGTCPYYVQFYDMADKHVVITTIHMAITMAMRGILPRPSILVIDEVDEVPMATLSEVVIDRELIDTLFEMARTHVQSEDGKKKLVELRYNALRALESDEKPSKKLYQLSEHLLPLVKEVLKHAYSDEAIQLSIALTSSLTRNVYAEDGAVKVVIDKSPFIYDIVKNSKTTILITGSPLDDQSITTIMRYLGISADLEIISSVPYYGKAIYVVKENYDVITKHNFELNKTAICAKYSELADKLLELSQKMFGMRRLYIPVIAYRYIYDCNFHKKFPGSLDRENKNAIDEFVRGDREVLISAVATRGLSFDKGAVLIMKKPWPDITSAIVRHIYAQPYGREYVDVYASAQVLQIISRFLRTQESEVIVGTLDKRVLESVLIYKRRGGSVYMLNGEIKPFEENLL